MYKFIIIHGHGKPGFGARRWAGGIKESFCDMADYRLGMCLKKQDKANENETREVYRERS